MSAARRPFGIGEASRRWWLVLLALGVGSVVTYRGRGAPPPAPARFGGPAQGTTYSVLLGRARPPQAVAALQAAVDSLLDDVDAHMSTWRDDSELARFNRHRDTVPMVLSPRLLEVLATAQQVSAASGGAFDVTVGPLVDLWGFGAGGAPSRLPEDSILARVRSRVGWTRLRLDGGRAAKAHPELELDLSAIAPGYTADRISALLAARGEPAHLVDVGGELRARGRNAAGAPFRVAIEEPGDAERRVRTVVALEDRALATSGNYRNYRVMDGVRYVHTIDPATGRPVRHRLLSVSVLHESAALADAWATALLVAGPERAWALAGANGLDVLLLVAGERGEVEERQTDGFTRARRAAER